MPKPEIKVSELHVEIDKAIKIIDKLLKINKIKIKYSINMNFKMKCYGEFNPENENEISINPTFSIEDSGSEINASYYSCDFSILGIAIHEIAHLLDQKFEISKEYRKSFPKQFILNHNSKKDRIEELAEILMLYILNPYLLKIINLEVFNFLKDYFISPSSCSKDYFCRKWSAWPKEIRDDCVNRWKISVKSGQILINS